MYEKKHKTINRPGLKIKAGLSAGEGLGDTMCRFATATGIKNVVDWYDMKMGNEGMCEVRHQKLNEWVPNMPW